MVEAPIDRLKQSLAELAKARAALAAPGRHTSFNLGRNGDHYQELPVKQARHGVNRYDPTKLEVAISANKEPVFDWDGTIVPEIKGNPAAYRAGLGSLTEADLSDLIATHKHKRIDIVTARPPLFHKQIRETANRLGIDVGDIHHGGFNKVEKIRELGRPLFDNNQQVVDEIHEALGADMATLVKTHTKAADSWLERWLALHASRDAANMTNPTGDALAAKLGGPLSLGLSEAVNNHLSLGDTKRERRETLTDAVHDVEHESYGKAALGGLKRSLPYILAGGIGGVAESTLPPMSDLKQGLHWNGHDALVSGGVGAGAGLSLAVLRPLVQKLILDNVSRKSKSKAIEIKADMPTATSLPFGDMLAAGLHKEAFVKALAGFGGKMGRGLNTAARYAAKVPEGEKYFSSPLAGAGRIARTAFLPRLPGAAKYLPAAVTGYGAYDLASAKGQYYNTANETVQESAKHLQNSPEDIEKATRLFSGQAAAAPLSAAAGGVVGSSVAAPVKDLVNATAEDGLMGGVWHLAKNWKSTPEAVRRPAWDAAKSVTNHVSTNLRYHLAHTPLWHQAAMAVGSPGQLLARKLIAPSAPDRRDVPSVLASSYLDNAKGMSAQALQSARDVIDLRSRWNAGKDSLTSTMEKMQEMARSRQLPATAPEIATSLAQK